MHAQQFSPMPMMLTLRCCMYTMIMAVPGKVSLSFAHMQEVRRT